MKPDLLRVWFRVTLLWWIVGAVTWAMSDQRIAASWFQISGQSITVNAFNAAWIALSVLRRWSLPVALINSLFFAAGIAGAWAKEIIRERARAARLIADPPWRDVKITIGTLPLPDWVQTSLPESEIQFDDDLAASIDSLPAAHKRVLNEVLTYIKMHPDAYVGKGHPKGMTLIEHTINVLSGLPKGKPDALLPILLAAHDMGKIRGTEQDKDSDAKSEAKDKEADAAPATPGGAPSLAQERDGPSVAKKEPAGEEEAPEASMEYHDDWSGLLLAGMPSFYDLPEADQRIAVLALRFLHKSSLLPQLPNPKEQDSLAALFLTVKQLDGSATAEEKRRTRAEVTDKPGLMRTIFIDCLHRNLQWQRQGVDRNVEAGGWRKGDRIYLSEPRLREALLRALRRHDPHLAAAWDEARQRGKTATLTDDLIEALKANEWLLTTIDGRQAREKPLWIVRSGSVTLNAMLIVEPPSNVLSGLPEAQYPITVLDGQFGVIETGPVSVMSHAPAAPAQPKLARTPTTPGGASQEEAPVAAPAATSGSNGSTESMAEPDADPPDHRPSCEMTPAEFHQQCRRIARRRGIDFDELRITAQMTPTLPIEEAYDLTFRTSSSAVKSPAQDHGNADEADSGSAEAHDADTTERFDNEPLSALAQRYGISEDQVREAAYEGGVGRSIHEAVELFLKARQR